MSKQSLFEEYKVGFALGKLTLSAIYHMMEFKKEKNDHSNKYRKTFWQNKNYDLKKNKTNS